MSKGADPLGQSGGSFDPAPGFGNCQQQQYELLISDARANPAEAEKFYRHAASLAREWQEMDACLMALKELSLILMQQKKHEDELYVLREIASVHKQHIKQDAYLIEIDKRIGICYARLRKTDKSIEHLRAAVLRCQASETESIDEFVDCLCSLASVYRLKDWTDRARTCIKQAYALVVDEPGRLDLQARVIEELANITYAQHKPQEATAAFIRVLKLKQEAFGPLYPGSADTFISLGMCYLDLNNLDGAESAFIQALEIVRQSGTLDRAPHANALEKLAGVYRKQARFLEATLIEQGASEIVGRAVDQRLGFFKGFDAALSAQRNKHYDIALNCYRQTLIELEFVFDKHAYVRVPILCRMAEIAEERKQKIQFKSLSIEIEDGLRQLCHQKEGADTCARLLQLARLFRLLKYDVFSDSCYRFAEKLQRAKPDERMAGIMNEHLGLIRMMESSRETQRMQKYLRRACRILGTAGSLSAASTLELKTLECDVEFDVIVETI